MEGEEETMKRSSSKGSMKIRRQSSSKGGSVKSKKKESSKSSKTPDSPRSVEQNPIEMLTPKQNGYVESEDAEESEIKHTASIKGMWKKAFKSLKSNDKQNWLSKKGSLIRRKEEEPESEPEETPKEIDPVYSLLKCAADLPKVPKAQKEGPPCSAHLGGRGDSSGSTSKASSPSSSGPYSIVSSGHGTSTTCSHSHSSSGGGGSISNRDHMHHIVDESLGSEFRTFYKLTSPVRKIHRHHSYEGHSKKHSPNSSFDHY